MTHKKTLIASLTAVLTLVGCGGGGSGSGGSDSPNDGGGDTSGPGPEAVFGAFSEGLLLDGATNGLTVEYPTGESAIVANGSVGYYADEPSTLSLGQSEIASVDGNQVIPFAGLSIAAGANADYWTNVGILLLSADSDGDASNGIEISAATRSVADSYSMDFNTDSGTFVATNTAALDDIVSTTARSSAASQGEAATWVSGIQATHYNRFLNADQEFLALFSEAFGFEGSVELETDGTGTLRTTNTGVFGDNFSTTDNQSPIVTWTTVNDPQYPSALTGIRFSTEDLTLTCYPLKENRMSMDAYCEDGETISRRYVLGDYTKPLRRFGDTDLNLTFGNLGAAEIDVYGTRGNPFGENSDNTLKGGATFAFGGGDYYEFAAGQWENTSDNDGFRFIEDASGDGGMFRVVGQLGLGAFEFQEESIVDDGSGGYTNQGDQTTPVAVVRELELTSGELAGKTFTRFNTSSFAEIETDTFNANGSTSSGYTWTITDGGDRLSVTGADYDRCTYAGEVVGDLFFYCDKSYEPSVGRFEQWVLDR